MVLALASVVGRSSHKSHTFKISNSIFLQILPSKTQIHLLQILQTTSQFHLMQLQTVNTMDNIPNLSDKHIGQAVHHRYALEAVTIHQGVWLRNIEEARERDLEEQMARFNTRGFDIMITLIRLLKSRGYEVASNDSLTTIEKAFLEVAEKDIGFDATLDWQIKRHLYNTMDTRNAERLSFNWSFRDLVDHSDLQNLFGHNPQFQLYSTTAFDRTGDGPWYDIQLGSDKLLQLQRTIFTPIQPLEKQIWEHTRQKRGAEEYQYLTEQPKFLALRYQTDGHILHMEKELQIMNIRTPAAKKVEPTDPRSWKFGSHYGEYRLCAIVRLDEEDAEMGVFEKIRSYTPGGDEIEPAPFGNWSMKPVTNFDRDWSDFESGNYILYYVRTLVPKDWPKGPLNGELLGRGLLRPEESWGEAGWIFHWLFCWLYIVFD